MRTTTRTPALVLAALVTLAALAPRATADGRVRWRERTHPLDELPADMPEAACAAVAAWAAWADEHGYRLDLEDGGRVLLVTPDKGGVWRSHLRLVDRTIRRFEAALPAPPRTEVAAAPAAGDPAPLPEDPGDAPLPEDPDDGPLPEDPEGTPPGFGPPPETPGQAGEEAWSTVWGTADFTPDAETIVFLVVRDERDWAELTLRLAADHDYLARWAPAAQRYTGFTLARPLAGAYVAAAPGQQEWRPDNELVHRLAELLLLRRFGQVPYWIQQGWAWHVEEDLLGGLYCFPYRDEFVWATEHTAWPGELQREFQDHREPVTIEELYLQRGCFDAVRGRRAFGGVRFLAEHREGRLNLALEALRAFRAAHDRVDQGGGTWTRDRDYEVPLAEQARLLREHLGDDVFAEMTRSFRLGDAYGG